jgi:cathepsin D
MFSSTLLFSLGLLCSLQSSFAAPDLPLPSNGGQSTSLIRRQPTRRSVEEWGAWAKKEREALEVKYGDSPLSRRNQGTNLYVCIFAC